MLFGRCEGEVIIQGCKMYKQISIIYIFNSFYNNNLNLFNN